MGLYNGLRNRTKSEAENLKLGQKGFDRVTQVAGATTGRFVSVFNPDDSEVTVVLLSNIGDDYTGKLPTKGTIYGDFKSIRCSTSSKSIIGVRL